MPPAVNILNNLEMDNAMEHDDCSTDTRHSLRQCRVVLEKIDLDKYNMEKKECRHKDPKMTPEMLNWRRSVTLKRNRLRGYIHTPEEYERKRAYSQMRQKNITPEQRAKKNVRSAIFRQRAKEKELLRIQTLKPEDMKRELKWREESNRIINARCKPRKGPMTEEKREAVKAAKRLKYHAQKLKLTDEQREWKKLRLREKYRTKLILNYGTGPIGTLWSMTDEQRERNNLRRREKRRAIKIAKENGEDIHDPDSLTDEQRERNNARRREKRQMMLKNKTKQDDEQRERNNLRRRERYKARKILEKESAKLNGQISTNGIESLTVENSERRSS